MTANLVAALLLLECRSLTVGKEKSRAMLAVCARRRGAHHSKGWHAGCWCERSGQQLLHLIIQGNQQ